MHFGKQLKLIRRQHGLSQEKLAKQRYVSRQKISSWENDKTYSYLKSLLSLAFLFLISKYILNMHFFRQSPNFIKAVRIKDIVLF